MHPLRKLRESGKPTPAQISELLAEDIVFNSPILVRPIVGREVIAAIFAQSSATRGSGTYTAEFKLDERTTFLRCGFRCSQAPRHRFGLRPPRFRKSVI
jgi:hypothetical protein